MQDRPIKPQKSPGKGLAALLFATSDSLTPTAVHVRRTLVRQTLAGLCLAALAFLLGRCTLLFGARPLGVALLCAASSGVLWIFAGLSLSALTGEETVVLLCTYLAALIIRILSRTAAEGGAGNVRSAKAPSENSRNSAVGGKTAPAQAEKSPRGNATRTHRLPLHITLTRTLRALFGESVYLRMMTSCVTAFIISLYTVIAGGFLYYDLFGALLSMILAPTATYLYAGLFSDTKKGASGSEHKLWHAAALCALCFSALYALRDATVFGISVGVFAGLFITLCVSRRRGALPGMVAAILCALGAAPALTPAFALAALCSATFSVYSPMLGNMTAFALAAAWDLYLNRLAALTGTLPAMLAAVMLSLGADHLITAKEPFVLFREEEATGLPEQAAEDITGEQLREEQARLRHMSEAFSSLSTVFYNLSDRMRRPGILDLRRVCDLSFEKACADCPRHDICWGADYAATLDMLSHLTASLYSDGILNEQAADEHFVTTCPSFAEITHRINEEAAKLTELTLRSEKTGIFAGDFQGFSQLICDALAEQNAEFLYDEALSTRVYEALTAMELSPASVMVYGSRRRRIIARDIDIGATRLGTADIQRRLEEACGFALNDIFYDFTSGSVTLTTASRPFLRATATPLTKSGSGETCGDTVSIFETEGDLSCVCLCDGMGTGRDAAFTSGVATLFLEKMLSAGNRPETALPMLSGILREKGGSAGQECSTGVDLLTVDLLCGKACFYKCGAAPSFIRRGTDLFEISANTAPIGILPGADVRKVTYDILPGDCILLMSDGVIPAQSDDPPAWLADLLIDNWSDDPVIMSDKIADAARLAGSTDDLSVVIVKVEERGRARGNARGAF